MKNKGNFLRAQSSLELLITVSFALIILLPIVIFAFVQIASSSANLAVGEAQAAATKLAEVAINVGSQGPPARQLVLVDLPTNIANIIIGNPGGSIPVGREIEFIVETNAGPSDAVAYVPINVTEGTNLLPTNQGTYLINVTAEGSCSPTGAPCVVIQST